MDLLTKYFNQKNIPQNIRRAIQKAFIVRKKTEDVLKRHIQMIDFANDTIMIRDLQDCITYWNQGAERLYGWTKKEALGKYVHTFLKTVFPESVKKALQTCLKTGHWEGELCHCKKDGAKIIVASRWTLQKNSQGKPEAFLEINNDITNLKQAEDALRKAHDELEERVDKRTTELKKINKELQKVIRDRTRLEKDILEISGMEQRRIGQDLHDGLSQKLTGVAFLTKVLEQRLYSKNVPEVKDVQKILELVNEAIAESRGLARGLDPVVLESRGLMAALQELASYTEKFFDVSCKFECARPVLIYDHLAAVHLYRIVQEAVSNAVKYSGDRKSTRLNSSHSDRSRMPSSA